MDSWQDLMRRLQAGLAAVERLDEPARAEVFDFLDALELAHRTGLRGLEEVLGAEAVERLRRDDPTVAWLFDAYGVGVDEHEEAEAALEGILPYIHSHGGTLELLDVADGVVRMRLAGSCSGCTASAVTLREGVERALREGFPGFVALEVEEDESATPHPPPGPTLLQLENRLG